MTAFLVGLPNARNATSIVASCRLYSLALELIHERPAIAYQLLISSVETIANAALEGFQPDERSRIKHKQKVYDLAISSGIDDNLSRSLAIEACKGDYWATKKFKKFLLE
jgi:hypothetical protein